MKQYLDYIKKVQQFINKLLIFYEESHNCFTIKMIGFFKEMSRDDYTFPNACFVMFHFKEDKRFYSKPRSFSDVSKGLGYHVNLVENNPSSSPSSWFWNTRTFYLQSNFFTKGYVFYEVI